jgi:hypothetical protein
MSEQRERLIGLAAEGIQEVSNEFAVEIERAPSIVELFEILTWALRTASGERLSDVHPSNIVALRPRLKKGAISPHASNQGVTPSAVADLNDAAFVAASDLLSRLTGAFKDAAGRLPKLSEFGDLIVDGLHRGDARLLCDVPPTEIAGVKAEVRKHKKINARVGDIVAIPAQNGEFFLAVRLTHNAFGTAFGLFDGTSRPRPISKRSHPSVNPNPIYSGDDLIEKGRWRIIGHDENLLSLYPLDPEIYHYQHEDKPNPLLGPYGSGETAAGTLRALPKEEAEQLGLLSNQYRQTYLPESLEDYLNAKLK